MHNLPSFKFNVTLNFIWNVPDKIILLTSTINWNAILRNIHNSFIKLTIISITSNERYDSVSMQLKMKNLDIVTIEKNELKLQPKIISIQNEGLYQTNPVPHPWLATSLASTSSWKAFVSKPFKQLISFFHSADWRIAFPLANFFIV